MKISQFLSRISFQKTIAAMLVMMILISQTIHVDFFDSVAAGPENYRDIVSIIIDRDTYTAERSRVMQYAGDIAGYLGGVRTSILVVEPNTPVAAIAAKNEKLYYEGDGEKGTSALIGTVLIGNIPIPIVEKDGTRFPSVYPYVDFTDKAFLYDKNSDRYTYTKTSALAEGVDIWHGVINPSVGRSWSGTTDIKKIGQFLDKTHEFYTHSGKFSLSTVPPKVLYYDGNSESKSINARSLFQYALSMKNAENIAYNRFTKYLLRDISNSLSVFDKQNEDPDIVSTYASLGLSQGNDILSEEEIKKLPDIQSKNVILSFLKNFKGIFNEKTLGDELLSVHNAGRYTSGSTVHADLLPISVTLMDEIAQTTLRETNNAIEKKIDTFLLDNNYARRIPIFDEIQLGSGTTDRNSPFTTISQNYSFGTKSTDIQDPLQCTIARGSTGVTTDFGRSQLVEANVAFDISKTESQIETLKKDTEMLVAMGQPNCFPNNKPKIDSYWGGNSILRIAGSSGNPNEVLDTFPTPTVFTGFTAPIFSLGGMKESQRLSVGSVSDCLPGVYQYTLSPARLMTYTESGTTDSSILHTCTTAYPNEWNRGSSSCSLPDAISTSPRYTCISALTSSGTVLDFASAVAEYSNTTPDCINGTLKLDGSDIFKKMNTCIITQGAGDSTTTVDNTQYKYVKFHTIPSLYKHTSPTDEEIGAAKANTVTPSLAIDMVRYVEFFTPKGNIARIHYPNFFEISATDIPSARAWITEKSRLDWQDIIDREQKKALTPKEEKEKSYLSGGTLPSEPVDWNTFISDEMIAKILQSRNWLQPDISIKYKQALEAMLSYSHGASGATTTVDIPPKIPSLSEEYEIAYLGLPSSFGADFSQNTDSALVDKYATRLREIEGVNISEEGKNNNADINNPATECGPPDGVPLAQWPSAIMCWIKAQFPPRILAGSCGPSTIGLDTPTNSQSISPSVSIISDTGALASFYTGSRLIAHLPRSSMQLGESMSVDFSLQKNNAILNVLPGTMAHLEVISGTTKGKNLIPSELQKYLKITPNSVPVGEKGAAFILESQGIEANLSLRAYYIVPLPDGPEIRINSSVFQIQITPEYYTLVLQQSGSSIANIDVTTADSVQLNINKILRDGTSTRYQGAIAISIMDDIDGSTVYSGSAFRPSIDTLPIDISKKVGVYRLIVRDALGINGEITFAVQSGKQSQIRITPVSSALVRGARTLAMVRLLDRLGNPTSPDLHALKIDVSGGYIIDANGEKRTSMNMDIMESQVPIILGSDTGGVLSITATTDNTITTTTDLNIYNTARIVLMRDHNPQVGGTRVSTHIEIQDESGKKISGLSSVASWKLPDGAGIFSKEAIGITDAISEPFDYIPGTISGDHSLMIDIPGIGSVSDMMFSVLPGDPLYIDHTRENNVIVFALRDRYGNKANATLTGSLSRNMGVSKDITMVNGIYTIPLQGGYYTMKVPGLKDYKLSYRDDSGDHTIQGIDSYIAYIAGNDSKIDFTPDYNARYTVLAGGEFLREGEDILYNTIVGGSQSLAVSTVLDSPYREDVLFSISPDGSYRLGQSTDAVLQTSISLQNNFPLLTVSDLTTKKQVVRVLYPMGGAILETCQKNQNETCDKKSQKPTIRLSLPTSSSLQATSVADKVVIKDDTISLLSIYNNGSISMSSDISLIPHDTGVAGLEMGVIRSGQEIATLVYMMDKSQSVQRAPGIIPIDSKNTPIILSSGFSIQSTYGDTLSTKILGYKIFRSVATQELDSVKNSPSFTDSIGALSEVPGVGWTGNNTMLLAYAGGDTVGESTRFFHTYTLVNLGDPVAHIDHGRTDTEIDGIDRSIGSIIARGMGHGISDFFHRDMNADGIEDLLVVYDDGYIELFLNQGGKFRSRGMITYNRDIDTKKISFGDFSGDGYGDIVGLNANGSLILIDNANRKFSRRDIILEGGAPLPSHISQLRVYDMDHDGRDDIIYITAGGELAILYGSQVPGTFSKKILDPTLGITLSDTPIIVGGAIKTDQTSQFQGAAVIKNTVTGTGADEDMLKAEAFYQYSKPNITPSGLAVTTDTLSGAFANAQNATTENSIDTYIHSQYATAYGLDIEKTYMNTTHEILYPNDRIRTTIHIHNTTNKTIQNIEYLDTLPKIFSAETTQKYTIKKGDTSVSRDFEMIGDNEYDAHFFVGDIAPGASLEISYELTALPASYGEMIVGDLEKGTVGADIYGDVGFRTSTTCGASMLLWTSGPLARDYTRGTHEFGSTELPDGIATRLTDSDNNAIPDSIENMSLSDRQKAYTDMTTSTDQGKSLMKVSQSGNELNIRFDDQAVDNITNITQNLMDGLACGFGGGSCMNFPLNWAPLAPGSSPTLFGFPLAPNLMSPSAGLPIFSALTCIPVTIPCGTAVCSKGVPSVWPMSPFSMDFPTVVPGALNPLACSGGIPGAGGILGTQSATNFLRIFVTPTLTLGMGTAICMGGPALVSGMGPPPGLSPLVQGGNCIVIAKPMNICKGDGSSTDGDVSAISGLGKLGDTWNAMSCQPQANLTSETEDHELTTSIVNYLKKPDTTRLTGIYTHIAKRGPRSLSVGPLLAIGSQSSGVSEVSIEVDSNTKISNISSVIKVKNKRIAAFPDFIMDWLTRQTEELTTSLFTPPNLTIIPPTDFGQNAQVDSTYTNFSKRLGEAYSSANLETMKQGMSQSFDAKQGNMTGVPDALKSTVGNTKGTLNSIKSAYTLIGKLPFVTIKQSNIPLNIPWIEMRELDKYKRALDGYLSEIENAGKNWCLTDPSSTCLDQKAKFQSGPFVSSIQQNLKRIEEYKKFPMKIQKYITWKERYIAQILCNINVIQQITSGWLRDNGVRFRKWAELFVLIKAVADSWQPLLDIFADMGPKCGTCTNERNNLQYWKFKLLSGLIPSIPVIKFPKWPDIILDLSDIRFGINISMPNFVPRISPIRLPDLPSLSIGSLGAALSLPGFAILPLLPVLPDLPDLPSLPKIKLPDLPPPPKIPKIAASITTYLSIMKLISKMYCYYKKTTLIPEWQVGDVIAQRTERQGTLPFDFINLSLPQFSLPILKEIRVGSHVNYDMRSEFITEFARSAVRPVNKFQTDLHNSIPTKVGENVSVPSVSIDLNKKLESFDSERGIHTSSGKISNLVRDMERDKDIFFEVGEFASHLMGELGTAGFVNNQISLQQELKVARLETEKTQNELIAYNDARFGYLREYLSSESDNNAHLQNVIDLFATESLTEPRQLIADISETSSRSTRLLDQFNGYQGASIQKAVVSTETTQEKGLSDTKIRFQSKLSRMIAANAIPTVSSSAGKSTENLVTGYTPNYQGIYVRTPSGVQTRLFDYIAPITRDTRVESIDIDRDGDTDYIYLLDGILYVKYSWKQILQKIIDTTTKISSVSSDDFMPYVPDYFHENISTPKNINFSFVPASQDETEWRANFYDQYTEWDHIDMGDHDPVKSPKTTVDMFLHIPSIPTTNPTLISHRVPRSLVSVADPASFALEGRSIDIYTGALSISLSPGRVLYTGRERVSINYKNQTTPNATTMTLESNTGYEFTEITEITMTRGTLYLIGEEDNSRHAYSDDLIGVPILPGMRLYSSDAGARLHNHTNGQNMTLTGGETYIAYDLGTRADHYEITLPYADGYYYVRLQNLTEKKIDRAGVVLFAPQATSDDSAPIIDLPTRIRLPTYSTKSYQISDILTDHTSTTISIDQDNATDTNNNGIFDDDFTSSGNLFNLSNQNISFGPFSVPGIYNMTMKVTDQMGNYTTIPFIIEVYTLISQIQNMTATGTIIGSLSESVASIPIHFFRVRPGEGPLLVSSGSSFSDPFGGFATGSFFKSPEVISLKGVAMSGSIDSHGGIQLSTGSHTEVVSATATDPMRILVVNQSGSISHIHTVLLPEDVRFVDLSKNSDSGTGLFIAPATSGTHIIPVDSQDTSIPGGTYITDATHHPLAAIARDGNIYTLDKTVTLKYRTQDGYMIIELVKDGKVIFSVEYRIDFFYTMQ